MKISEFLPVTYRLVTQHVDADWKHTRKLVNKFRDLIQFEEKWSWACLQALFAAFADCEATPEVVAGFYHFLHDRWARIKDIYYLHYTTQYRSSLTIACASLANELPGKHRFETLMPGLNTVNDHLTTSVFDNKTQQYVVTEIMDFAAVDKQTADTFLKQCYITAGANIALLIHPEHINTAVTQQLKPVQIEEAAKRARLLSEPHKIQLHDFILDNQNRVMHVYETLMDAKRDNLYKHSHAAGTQGSITNLNKIEIEKIIHHSIQATNYAVALEALWKSKKTSYSIGGFLTRLISGLRAGGVSTRGSGGTQDGLPGHASFESVESFFSFTKLLTQDQLERLLDLNREDGINKSFRYYWYRLLAATNWCLDLEDYKTLNEFFGICIDEYNLGQAEPQLAVVNQLSINVAASPRNGVRIETPRIATPIVLVPDHHIPAVASVSEAEVVPASVISIQIDMPTEQSTDTDAADKAMVFKFFDAVEKYRKPFDDIPCVEIYSGHFDDMLQQNYWLFDEVPAVYQDKEKESLSKVQAEFDEAQETLRESISAGKLNHYTLSELKSQSLDFIVSAGNDTPEFKKLCCSLLATPEALIYFFRIVPSLYQRWILRTYMRDALKALVDSAAKLIHICSQLAGNEQHILLSCIREFYDNVFLRELIADVATFANLLAVIRADCVQYDLVKNLCKKHCRSLISYAEDFNLISLPQYMLPKTSSLLLELLGTPYVQRVQETYRTPPSPLNFFMGLPQSLLSFTGQTVNSLSQHSLGLFRNDKRRMDQVEESNKRLRCEEESNDQVMPPAQMRR